MTRYVKVNPVKYSSRYQTEGLTSFFDDTDTLTLPEIIKQELVDGSLKGLRDKMLMLMWEERDTITPLKIADAIIDLIGKGQEHQQGKGVK